MILEDLYNSYVQMSSEEKEEFVRSYRNRRSIELSSSIEKEQATGTQFSPEEKALLKKLGISIKAVKQIADAEDDDEEGFPEE